MKSLTIRTRRGKNTTSVCSRVYGGCSTVVLGITNRWVVTRREFARLKAKDARRLGDHLIGLAKAIEEGGGINRE